MNELEEELKTLKVKNKNYLSELKDEKKKNEELLSLIKNKDRDIDNNINSREEFEEMKKKV